MISFTRATPPDRKVLGSLMQQFYAEEKLPLTPPVGSAVDELLAHDHLGQIHLIRNETTIVGYFVLTFGYSLERGGRTALLDELYVIPSHRGRGIGTTALTFAAETARTDGCRALHLEVDEENVKARELYRRAGFAHGFRDYLTKPLEP